MIKLINFKSNIYSYPLVLLKGRVYLSTVYKEIKVRTNSLTNSWPIVENKFKILVHLKNNANEMEIWLEESNKIAAKLNLQLIFNPPLSDRHLRIVYLLCENENGEIFENGKFQSPSDEDNCIQSAVKRIAISMLMVQCFFAQTLPTGQTFKLELESDNYPKVHLFKLKLCLNQIWSLNSLDLWQYVAKQLMCSVLAHDYAKYVAFCSFTRYSNQLYPNTLSENFSQILSHVKGYISLGGGGLALMGSACLYTWPSNINEIMFRFTDKRQVDKNNFMDDSGNRGMLWSCYATTLGACAHEIGHILDLGHSKQGIMALEFNNIDKFYTIKTNSIQKIKWWMSSEVNILSHHKWINDNNNIINESDKQILFVNNIIKSNYGIVVIEYRDPINNEIISNQVFTLPAKTIKIKQFSRTIKIFAIDLYGNILNA